MTRRKLTWTVALMSLLVLAVQVGSAAMASWWAVGADKVLTTLHGDLPMQVLLAMLAFVAVVVGAHVVVAAVTLFSASSIRRHAPWPAAGADAVALLGFGACWTAVYLANSIWFPNSAAAYDWLRQPGWARTAGTVALWTAAALAAGPALAALVLAARRSRGIRVAVMAAAVAVAASGLTDLVVAPAGAASGPDTGRPNVVIVGVDSLRPDIIEAPRLAHRMPSVNGFLEGAARFEDAYTPLARTYPSWVSILTGQYPARSGARINLIDPAVVRTDAGMPWRLKEAGYRTVHAIDERRFSNIDESYGFDEVIGPAAGAADFLMGLFGDLPVVNVLSATPLGDWLLPYHRANRALHKTYHPEVFDRLLSRRLAKGFSEPVFLTVHFCLPHWPYVWGLTPASGAESDALPTDRRQPGYLRYLQALARADAQVGALMTALKDSGVLDNAIVVLLSDHGEAFGFDGDLPERLDRATHPYPFVNRGHGTNIFSRQQSRVVLAFRRYGGTPFPPGLRDQPATVADVAPTLVDLLGLDADADADGMELSSWLRDPARRVVPRTLFLESGYTLDAIARADIDEAEVVRQGAGGYRIDGNGRLIMRSELAARIIADKQLGGTDGAIAVGSVPGPEGGDRLWYAADWQQNWMGRLDVTSSPTRCDDACRRLAGAVAEHFGSSLPGFLSAAR